MSNSTKYGHDDSSARLLRYAMIGAVVFLAVGMGIVVVGNTVYVPLMRHWDMRLIKYDEAVTWLDSPTCLDSSQRIGLKGYDKCPEHKHTASKSPFSLAVNDLIEDYWCEKGRCMLDKFDIFTLMFTIVPWLFLAGIIVVGALSCTLFLFCWRRQQSSGELPYAGLAAIGQMAHQHYQLRNDNKRLTEQ